MDYARDSWRRLNELRAPEFTPLHSIHGANIVVKYGTIRKDLLFLSGVGLAF